MFMTRPPDRRAEATGGLRDFNVKRRSSTPLVAAAAMIVRGDRTYVVAIPVGAGPARMNLVDDAFQAIRALWHNAAARASALWSRR